MERDPYLFSDPQIKQKWIYNTKKFLDISIRWNHIDIEYISLMPCRTDLSISTNISNL
jgi:hypothetical protein